MSKLTAFVPSHTQTVTVYDEDDVMAGYSAVPLGSDLLERVARALAGLGFKPVGEPRGVTSGVEFDVERA